MHETRLKWHAASRYIARRRNHDGFRSEKHDPAAATATATGPGAAGTSAEISASYAGTSTPPKQAQKARETLNLYGVNFSESCGGYRSVNLQIYPRTTETIVVWWRTHLHSTSLGQKTKQSRKRHTLPFQSSGPFFLQIIGTLRLGFAMAFKLT